MPAHRLPFTARRILRGVSFGAALVWLCFAATSARAIAPFSVGGHPDIYPGEFRVTTFATGLDFPYALRQLSDGSILVGTGSAGPYNTSTGQLIRYTDANADGVADGAGQVLYSGFTGGVTALNTFGDLVVVTSSLQGRTPQKITFLRTGATPADPLTPVGSIDFTLPNDPANNGRWVHTTYENAIRPVPGDPSSFQVLFNVGSHYNTGPEPVTGSLSGLVSGTIQGASVYMVTVQDTGGTPTVSNLTRVASGLRNAAGMAFNRTTGDLYIEDNGIDGPPGMANNAVSADEINVIPAAHVGTTLYDFGFPNSYTEYQTGVQIGGTGTQPAVALQPWPDPFTGSKSQGATQLAYSPNNFPAPLQNGVFVGFHGRGINGGLANDLNPVVFANPTTGEYFHFISNNEANIGHPDGLLSTADSLFIADMSVTGPLNGTGLGAIYQVQYTPLPPVVHVTTIENQKLLGINAAGRVTTVADVGDGLFSPIGVASDAAGNSYVSDFLLGKIYKVNPAGTVTTLATGGGIISPVGVSMQGSNVLVDNYLVSTVSSVTPAGTVTQFAGPSQLINSPFDSVTDTAGNTYVVEIDAQRVVKIDSLGNASVFADIADGLFSPVSIEVDAGGNVYVGDALLSRVYKFTPAGAGSVFADAADGVVTPTGLAFDAAGILYVANYLGNNVLQFDSAGNGSVLATTNRPFQISALPVASASGASLAVPEPSSLSLAISAAAALAHFARRSRRGTRAA